ncbi:hypothetical protein SAMN05216244_3372 [Sediminibacillus halophilus]|uniref:Uncharacterized protein n=1 Tax=Sediminibacillus halophilus TaxID=482461 RepID=A0A1G9W0D2_9BACI|nr:hypothetical protein SAMN05216244_3372 [Sediminibacillus halophilus]
MSTRPRDQRKKTAGVTDSLDGMEIKNHKQ